MKIITRTVWILSLVSLFTDMASEMLYPVMPVYLRSIGFSVLLIGILEGVAEATAGLSKGYFGKRSDLAGKRVPFVQAGYALSALSKPLMAVLAYPLWILGARTIDRFGKGIRTGARDALLSDESTPESKGRVFGFHRSMDTLGAVLGPAAALVYLWYHPGQYRTLFLIAFVPGILAVTASFLLSEKKQTAPVLKKPTPFFSFLSYWPKSPPAYRKLATGLLLFTLFNSSDVFLLLQARACGLTDPQVIGVYIFYNLVYALSAFPAGTLADRVGLKPVFLGGLALFAIVYGGMATTPGLPLVILLFFLYGIYAAATEGISKAWIAMISAKKDTATAIGTFSGLQSLCMLVSSTLAGLAWYRFGAAAAFGLSAVMAVVTWFYLLRVPRPVVPVDE
ncbi:MAG: transporter [Flaviaesturariibacter sp.]|nr:transporter [Flaviaesturariibacter sp.]